MLVCALGLPNRAHRSSPSAQPEQPLPARIVIDVDSPEPDLYRIAIPNLLGGSATLCAQGADVLRNDLQAGLAVQRAQPALVHRQPAAEGLGITKAPWSSVGAQGVVKGQIGGNTRRDALL